MADPINWIMYFPYIIIKASINTGHMVLVYPHPPPELGTDEDKDAMGWVRYVDHMAAQKSLNKEIERLQVDNEKLSRLLEAQIY